MYRSGDAGVNWTEITKGLPSDFDFPLAVHPRDPNTIFVMPLKGAEFRCPPENKLRVFRSRDAGATWQALGVGLPQSDAFVSVYREGWLATRRLRREFISAPTPAKFSARRTKAIRGRSSRIICRPSIRWPQRRFNLPSNQASRHDLMSRRWKAVPPMTRQVTLKPARTESAV